MILRIKSDAGLSRIEIEDTETLAELSAKVAVKFHVSSVRLYHPNGSLLDGPTRSIKALRLTNGMILKSEAISGTCSVQGQYSSVGKSIRLEDIAAQVKIEEDAKKKNEAKFLNFDDYLRKNLYKLGNLPLAEFYKSKIAQKGEMTKIPPCITLKYQKYRHVDHVEVMNVPAVQSFVSYWRDQKQMLQPRVGVLYGYYTEYDHYEQGIKAVIEAVHEPPQLAEGQTVVWDMDAANVKDADIVAEGVGLERIGLIITHDKRQFPEKTRLTAHELYMAATWNLRNITREHYTNYPHSRQVLVTISPDEDGQMTPNSFMLSDLGLAMVRDNIIVPHHNDVTKFTCRASVYGGEMMPDILEGGMNVRDLEGEKKNRFDADWFIIRLNDGTSVKPILKLPKVSFPVVSRTKVRKAHLVNHLKEGHGWKTYADFQLLLYLAGRLTVSVLKPVLQAISSRKSTIPIDIHRQIKGMNVD